MTSVSLTDLRALADLPHDTLIDARSEAEFAEDHIPGAINLPVLSNEERATVGTIYVQDSRFKARRVGGAMVARNIADHLDGPLAGMPGGWRPLVYCWRGGQRSGAFARYLAEVGWRAETLAGGYRTYRRLVAGICHDAPFAPPVWLLDGNTGTAKTDLLARLAARGVQVLDLEGAAEHRGSIFGGREDDQPSQKRFEGRLAAAMVRLDPARPVVIEAESSKIGRLIVPPTLWAAMKGAPRMTIRAPLAARTAFTVSAYDDLWASPERLSHGLATLARQHGRKQVAAWEAMLAAGDYAGFTETMIGTHYDAAYARARQGADPGTVFETDSLDETARERLADRITRFLSEALDRALR